ncbi:MAG: hypothetical protein WC008_06085, partial [Bacilli bacterium]
SKNGIVGIFPEGQISSIGKSKLPSFAIAKLIKNQGVDVFAVKHHNAYFVNPPWSKKSFPGRINSTVEKILTKEDISKLTDKEIFDIIKDKLDYNADLYNEEHKMKYKVKNINNLQNLIYQCPKCFHEGLRTNKNTLECPNCNYKLIYNKYGRFDDYTISQLYKQQEEKIKEQLVNNPDFYLIANVKLECYRNNLVCVVGEGTLKITKDLYTYDGTIDGVKVIKNFKTSNIPYLPSDIGVNVQIYENYMLYQFVFEEKKLTTKFVIAGECSYILHSNI